MSISLITTPQKVQSVYNPIWFEVSSTNTTKPDFHYVFDIYVNNVFEERYKLLPRPITANCIFSPASVLESYLSYDLNISSTTGATTNNNCILKYDVKFGEEYVSVSGATTGTTIYSGLSTSSGYTYNGVLGYENITTWDFNDYGTSTPTRKFLNNSPNIIYLNEDDRYTLSYLNLTSGDTANSAYIVPNRIIIATYDRDNNLTQSNILRISNYTGSSSTNKYIHIGAGVWNINNISATAVWDLGGTQPIFDDNRDVYYTIQLFNDDGFSYTFCSEIKTFYFNTCTKYEPKILKFLNGFGNWDYFSCNLKSKKKLNVTNKTTYTKNLGINYSIGDRGTTILNIDANHKMNIVSNWINDDTAEWLQEILLSPEVYELRSDGTQLPIIIDTTSYDIGTVLNDKLFNVVFDYTYAYKINTQRG